MFRLLGLIFDSEEGGSFFLRTVSEFIPDYTEVYRHAISSSQSIL
jgi:hypothetical protein